MDAIRYCLDYINHRLTSKSRHGTHSPFVYQLVDEVVYAKRQKGEANDKVQRLIDRLMRRFNSRQVYRLGSALPPDGPLDIIVFQADYNPKTNEHFLHELLPKLHQGSVLVVTAVYHSNDTKQFWRSIKAIPGVTVTIDLFDVGLVFFHVGQAKENFRIRF